MTEQSIPRQAERYLRPHRWVIYAPTPAAPNGAPFATLPESATEEHIAAEVERAKAASLDFFAAFFALNARQKTTTYRRAPLTPEEITLYQSRVEARFLPTPREEAQP